MVEKALQPQPRSGDRFDKYAEFVAESLRQMGPQADMAMIEMQQVMLRYRPVQYPFTGAIIQQPQQPLQSYPTMVPTTLAAAEPYNMDTTNYTRLS